MTNTTASPRTLDLIPLALRLDAAVTGANGLAYLAAAGPLEDLLGLDAAFLRTIGGFLLVFAALVWATGARAVPRRGAVRAVIAVNVAWVLGSLALAVFGLASPSSAGTVWAVLQAGVVGVFAELQVAALRRRP